MDSQPAHKDICGVLVALCMETIVNIEAQLAKQRQVDEAEAKRLLDEKKAMEATQLATKEKIKKMQDELEQMENQ